VLVRGVISEAIRGTGKPIAWSPDGKWLAYFTTGAREFTNVAIVNERRAYVLTVSGGKPGYVHMPDMSAASLAQLYVDLDADNIARDGVIIDIRNNNGGFVNAYALDVFSRQHYLNMTCVSRRRRRRVRCWASARSRSRRCSSPTSIRCRTRRISRKATAR